MHFVLKLTFVKIKHMNRSWSVHHAHIYFNKPRIKHPIVEWNALKAKCICWYFWIMFSDFEKGSKPNLPPCRWTWGCNKWALWVSLVGISIFLSVSQFGTAAFLVNAGCKRGEQEQRNCRIRLHLTNGCPGRGFMSPPSQSRWSHCLTVTQSGALVTAQWEKMGVWGQRQ